jgi:hypothetical protein
MITQTIMLLKSLDIAYTNKNNDGLDESNKANEMHVYLMNIRTRFST